MSDHLKRHFLDLQAHVKSLRPDAVLPAGKLALIHDTFNQFAAAFSEVHPEEHAEEVVEKEGEKQ